MSRALALALILAAAFGVWETWFAAFMADDLMQLGVLEGVSPAAAWTGPFATYTLADGDPAHLRTMQEAGLFPWFTPSTFEMRFFRPLSAALLVADHALFGLRPAGYHVHGVLWALALVAVVGTLFRRALPGRAGTLALAVFVLSAIHGIFCWTAARHIVVAAALGFAALAAHVRWREDGWRPGLALELVALVASLLAGEVGVAVVAYLVAYELFGARGAFTTRARAAAPALAVVAVYLVVWRLLGSGASSAAGYLDPLRDPRAFLIELPARLAVLAGGIVAGGGVDLWVLRPDLRGVLAGAGALLALGFAVLVRAAWRGATADQRRAIAWLGTGAIASAVPFAGTPMGSRCLLVPFVGGAALVAVVVDRWWRVWRRQAGVPFRALGAAAAVLALVHLGIAPLGRLASPVMLKRFMGERAAAAVRDAELDPATLATTTAVVLVAPDLIVGLHGAFHRVLHRQPMPAAWRVLSWAPAEHRFSRTAVDTLEMVVGGGLESRLEPGAVVRLGGMEATVLEAGGPGPSRVRIRFDRSLDDPGLVLLAWRDERLRRVAPPPIGGDLVVPYAGTAP